MAQTPQKKNKKNNNKVSNEHLNKTNEIAI